MKVRVRDYGHGLFIQAVLGHDINGAVWQTTDLQTTGTRESVEQRLDGIVGSQSRKTIMAEFDTWRENDEQLRHAASLSHVRMSGLPLDSEGGTGTSALHSRSTLRSETAHADGDEPVVRPYPSAEMERLPHMDETTPVESDAEKVAKTLETSIAARRAKRKEFLTMIDGHLASIDGLRVAISELDHVIKTMGKAASRLRER